MAIGALGALAIGTGALGGIQSALGFGARRKARRMRKRAQRKFEANQFQIPESAKAALEQSQRRASEVGLAGQDVMEAQIGQTTAQGVGQAQEAATSSSDILGALSSLYGNQQMQQQQLGLQAAQQYEQNQLALQQSLGQMANWEQEKWKYNVLYPYQQQMAAAGQMRTEGTQMINQGIGTIAGAAGGMMQVGAAQQGLQQQQLAMQKLGNPVMQAQQPIGAIQNTQGLMPMSNPYQQQQPQWGTSYKGI